MIDIRLGRWQDRLRDVPDASVRLILTSPPYDNARTYEGTNEPVDFAELAAFALRVLCPGGTLAMVLDGPAADGAQSVTPFETIVSWSRMPGWQFRQCLAYARSGQPGNTPGRFRKDHEPLIVFVRSGGVQICEKDRISTRAFWPTHRQRGRDARSGKVSMDVRRNLGSDDESRVTHRGSIWWYAQVGHGNDPSADTGHPATFAEAFALDAVKVWSNPGDLVCDPFTGSGTVAVACRGLGRSFVGSERVPLYHEIALRRLDPTHVSPERAAEPVGPLFAAVG